LKKSFKTKNDYFCVFSDQSDPFNRSPLTLQDVIPNPELKTKIEEWKTMKRQEAANKNISD